VSDYSMTNLHPRKLTCDWKILRLKKKSTFHIFMYNIFDFPMVEHVSNE